MKKPMLITGIVAGSILCLGPLFGLLGTLLGMIRAFGQMSTAESASPEALAHDISLALYTTLGGIVAVPVGIIILVLSIIGLMRYNRNAATPAPSPSP